MRFIFKLMFYGFLALAILPSFADSPIETSIKEEQSQTAQKETAFNSVEALQLAASVASDVRSICSRDPYVCETGQKIVIATLERAKHGAYIVAGMVENHRDKRKNEADITITGSVQ
ncbi:DUF5330 domain-containing protein [Ahrensia kielensis]|uniref:DUF5330 domain-containing protein n=1 Tax=Ahrensia kielensis TaxID=76980 RepID=UPI00036828B1|nr:DUF5330 domain-containing protein [Ahrensia kielensis]